MQTQATDQTALTRLSATELAARIASGELSSAEVIEAHIARIEQINPALNAVVVKRYDAARAEAHRADEQRRRGEPLGRLHGVPVTIKEALDLEGTPSTFGIPSRAGHEATEDDAYVARLRQAGAVVLGKTNVAQLLMYIESDNPVYGRTNNPWNVERSSGGSSGGEGAIIAAGGSPLGLGTDLGGSLRVPAAFCGIASFKPTAGRTPDAGRLSSPFGQRAIVSQVGALARHVDDVALTIELISGGSQPYEPVPALGDPATVDIARLRIAYYTDDGTLLPSPAAQRAVKEVADMFKRAGATVIEWQPPNVAGAVDLFYSIMSADGATGFKRSLGKDKRDPRMATIITFGQQPRRMVGGIERMLKLMGQHGTARTLHNFGYSNTAHYWDIVEAQIDYQARFAAALDQSDGGPFDLILCPACALPAFTHGASGDLGVAGGYTVLYNVLGYPTGIVPITRVRPGEEEATRSTRDTVEKTAHAVEVGSAGLPIGVQVVARPWRDHVALAAMKAIETEARTRSDYPTLDFQI